MTEGILWLHVENDWGTAWEAALGLIDMHSEG